MPPPRSPRRVQVTPPLHPEDGWGSGSTPATHEPLPWLSSRHRSLVPKHRLPVRGSSSASPKTPQSSCPSPPPTAWRVPGPPAAWHCPAASLHPLMFLFCISTKPAVSHAPGATGPVGKGQELGGKPTAPRELPASHTHGQGREQMVPLGTAARHSTGSLGTAWHSSSGRRCPAPAAAPRPHSHPAGEGLGFPGAGVVADAGCARTVPCHPTRQHTAWRHAHVLTLHRYFWL